MNRRDFLKVTAFGLLNLGINGISGEIPELDGTTWKPKYEKKPTKLNGDILNNKFLYYKDSVKSKVTKITGNYNREFNRSLELVGEVEINIFKLFFNINSSKEFVLKVKEIQKNFGLKVDGIIGVNTLVALYKNFYIPQKEFFLRKDFFLAHISSRINDYNFIENIKEEMKLYPYKFSNNGVKPDSRVLLKILNKKVYGDKLSINKSGTFINKDLYGKIPFFLSNNDNIIFIENFFGKKIMRVYINGKLEIATYVSPGKKMTKTPEGIYNINGLVDKYHASSNKEYRGAVMPYAVHIIGGIWLHGSDGIIDGNLRSHGCIRVPLFYQKKLYELVKSGVRFKINTKKIYKNFDIDYIVSSKDDFNLY